MYHSKKYICKIMEYKNTFKKIEYGNSVLNVFLCIPKCIPFVFHFVISKCQLKKNYLEI